jgi:hypothetical protein
VNVAGAPDGDDDAALTIRQLRDRRKPRSSGLDGDSIGDACDAAEPQACDVTATKRIATTSLGYRLVE